MDRSQPLAEQISTNFERVVTAPKFSGERLWLTFYMSGQPQDLERLGEALSREGWANVSGWEGGFIYPKIEVSKAGEAITVAANAAQKLVGDYGAEIINIDADTSPEVERSLFITLYRSPT